MKSKDYPFAPTFKLTPAMRDGVAMCSIDAHKKMKFTRSSHKNMFIFLFFFFMSYLIAPFHDGTQVSTYIPLSC